MEGLKKNYVYVGKGVLRACMITLIAAFILALIQTFSNIGGKTLSVAILMTTMISVIYGCIYSTRKINSRGWLVGILVSLMYILVLLITAFILGKDSFQLKDFWRILLAVVTGTLSGMLGINL